MVKLDTKKAGIISAIIICAFFLFRAAAIMLEGEAGRLKRTIYKCKRLAEKESLLELAASISLDYEDELGNDKGTLLSIARTLFNAYRGIIISINELTIKIEKEDATAQVQATVCWRENGSDKIFYDRVRVESKFRKEGGGWKVIELKFFKPQQRQLFRPLLA